MSSGKDTGKQAFSGSVINTLPRTLSRQLLIPGKIKSCAGRRKNNHL